ncbi:HPr-rel-A system PqqD family peptide chaperone [Sphingomonas sp. PAMC 26617]|uniref:HPr-rel-A system PqqD family peptide chaperone n=1 Tax=Sphingomonas sp. PAMC 26617 TaxID=1112216 RepID=UPI0002889765|nr:HPr-rel-A system PqqD family peptide chaperone [Sphingomonas sp. PAMC 26617]
MPSRAAALLYRMARPETLDILHIDSFTALYHRASGITHLLAAPAPEILAALGEAGLTRAALLAKLRADYALEDADEHALGARLDELVATGLVACERVG